MSDMPEEIWATSPKYDDAGENNHWSVMRMGIGTYYIRADKYEQLKQQRDASIEIIKDLIWYLEKKLDDPTRINDLGVVRKANKLIAECEE